MFIIGHCLTRIVTLFLQTRNNESKRSAGQFLRVAGAGGGRAAAIIMEENFAAKPQGVRACGQGGGEFFVMVPSRVICK